MGRPRRQVGTMRAVLALAVLVTFGWPGRTAAQTFYPDDPLVSEPTPLPAIDPGPRNLSFLLEAAGATFGHPGERQPLPGVVAARGVNTLGDVSDGSWFVNRHGRTRLTVEELLRGSGDAHPPSTDGPWHVVLLGSQVARPTILVRDAAAHMYVLRFDPPENPELATGADMISSRIFHALGYYVPETYLVAFTRDRLIVENNATGITSLGGLRDLLPEDIDRLLARVARRPDGSYRAVALMLPTAAEALIGPFQFYGTRSDDPNDVVQHEHRRDLRGLQVFAAWVNHTHMDPLHTMDIVVEPEGQPRQVRHFLFDFMATLGSGLTGPKPAWEGRDRIYAQSATLRNMAGLGIYTPAWMRATYPDLPAVGRFESKTFEPDKWTPTYELAPFANRLPDDTYWAARQVMAFSDEDIRAIVRVAEYSDPAAGRWIADTLIDRRDRIGRTYFAKVLPLDDFAVRGAEIAFTDLAVQRGWAEPRRYRADWSMFDNKAGKPSTRIDTDGGGLQVPAGAMNAPAGSYILARITAEGAAGMAVNVYLRRDAGGLRVVGIDREWPGRKLVKPQVVVHEVRNRYLELEPDRQKLFDTYARSLDAKTGQTLSSEDRFRTLSPSEQTTFDGITHALLHTPLSDDQGQSLGRALDLVTSVERIAGQQAGRGGDQQFRLYVTLGPDARATVERSRELLRDRENTVYHAGYPHSFRTAGVPSVQISMAEDSTKADIDVDYRTSKAPKSLFNGHLTASNSDVRAGDNAQEHDRRWTGFPNWWSSVFGKVQFVDTTEPTPGPFGAAPTRAVTPLPADRPANASIPDVADAVQEFLTDWLVRRNYRDAASFLAPDALLCIADSLDMSPKTPPAQLRQAALQLLEKTAKTWGHPGNLTEAMNPVFPWAPSVRVMRHAFDQDFTMVEAPTELGAQYECGAAAPPKRFEPATTPQYGTYYGALLQVVQEGHAGGTLVLVWRRVEGEWRLVAYRAVD